MKSKDQQAEDHTDDENDELLPEDNPLTNPLLSPLDLLTDDERKEHARLLAEHIKATINKNRS